MSAPLSERLVLDFDGYLAEQDQETKDRWEKQRAYQLPADNERSKKRIGAMAAVAEDMGIDRSVVADEWDRIRAGYAVTNGWDDAKDDDDKVFAKIVEKKTKQREERHLLDGLDDPKAPDYEAKKKASLTWRAQEAAYTGKPYGEALADWQKANANSPGYVPDRFGGYEEVARTNHAAMTAQLEKVRPVAALAFDAISQKRGVTKDAGGANAAPIEFFRGLTPDEKQLAFRVMGDTFGGNQEKGLAEAFFTSVGRGGENLLTGAQFTAKRDQLRGVKFKAGDVVTEQSAENEAYANYVNYGARSIPRSIAKAKKGRELTAEEAAKWNEDIAAAREDVDTADQLIKFGQEFIDPAKGGGTIFRKFVLPVADSAALMASLAIPGATLPALEIGAKSYQNEDYRAFRAMGMDREEADRLAGPSSVAKALIDKAQLGIIVDGFPGVKLALQRFALSGSTTARFGGNFAGTFIPEVGFELTQEIIIPAMVQDILTVNPEWDVKWGKVWSDVAKALPETAAGMVLLSGAGAAGQTMGQATVARELLSSGAALRASGYTLPQISEIQAAPEEQQRDLLAKYYPEKAPVGEERETLIAETQVLAAAEMATFQEKQKAEVIATSEAMDYAARVTRKGDGWEVTTESGKTIMADSAEAARRIREDLRQVGSQAEADALVAAVDDYVGKREDAEVELTGDEVATNEAGELVATSVKGEFRLVEDEKTLDALHEEATQLGMASGNGPMMVAVNGSNTVWKKKVADGAREIARRIVLNRSASSYLTFIHEATEADFRAAVLAGAITQEEGRMAVSAVAAAFDPSFAKQRAASATDAKEKASALAEAAFRERVQKVARGEGSETELRETISELSVANEIGRRKDGGKQPVGAVTAALDAALRGTINRKEARALSRFRAFLRAAKQYFRAVLGTVAALKKSGKAEEFGAFLDKVQGITEQSRHDAALVEELSEYVPPTAEEQAAGIAFSIGDEKQARAKAGGETGPNGEWYPGGAYIATTDMPKRLKEKLKKMVGDGSVEVARGQREQKNPGFFSPFRNLAGTVMGANGEINEEYLTSTYNNLPAEWVTQAREAVRRWKAGERQLSIAEFPQLANASDLANTITAGEAIPGDVLESKPWAKEFVERFTAKTKPAFSLSSGAQLEAIRARLDNILAKDPAKRRELAREANKKLQKLQFDWEARIADPRSRKSLGKEQSMRKALREEELYQEALSKLTPEALNALAIGAQKLSDRPLIAAMLQDHGLLRSKSSMGDKFALGEYDDAPSWMPPTWFSDTGIAPDTMAQRLYEDGILKVPGGIPKAGDLWAALGAEIESYRKSNAVFRNALANERAARKTAVAQANAEAETWRTEADKEQRTDNSDNQRLLRSMRTLDAILSVMPPEIRGKVGGFIKLATLGTDEARVKEIGHRIEMLSKEVERHLKAEYELERKKLFKRAKPKQDKAGKKPVGKAGADVHDLFSVLQKAVEWTPEETQKHLAGLEGAIASGDLSPEQEAHAIQEAALVDLFGDWRHADANRRVMAVEEATRVFEDGYLQFQEEKLKKSEQRAKRRDVLRDETGKPEGTVDERKEKAVKDHGLIGNWKDAILGLLSFEQLSGWVFGDASTEARRLADMERAASYKSTDEIHALQNRIAETFTELAGGNQYKGEQLHWRLTQPSIGNLSELEAITATLMWRQPDGRRHMEGRRDENNQVTSGWSYDQAFIDNIEASLSDEAKAVRAMIAEQYAGEYEDLNKVYRDLNGINLPHNPFYSPLTVKPQNAPAGQMADPLTGGIASGSRTPGALKSRGSATAEPEFRDAIQTLIAHGKQMAHWKAYAPLTSEARSLLGNREVGNSVEASSGKEAATLLRGWIDFFEQGGTRDASAHLALNQKISRASSRAASIAIVGRISTLVIQSTQLGAGIAEMPTGAYLSRLGKLFTGQLGWGNALASPYIQRRLAQMPPVVRAAMEGLNAEKPNQLRRQVQRIGMLISGADALFTAGTFAMVYDYQLSQAKEMGLDDQAAAKVATKAAERSTDRIAQPVRAGARSLFENTATNPFVRIGWAFASEPRKNLALMAYSLAQRDMATKARAVAYVVIFNALLGAMIRAAIRDARDPEDDEIFDDKHWGIKRFAIAAATEPLQGLPVFGDVVQGGVNRLAGVYVPEGNLLSGAGRAASAIGNIPELLSGEADMEIALRDAESILSGIGIANSNLAAMASISHIARDLYGTADNLSDTPEERAKKDQAARRKAAKEAKER